MSEKVPTETEHDDTEWEGGNSPAVTISPLMLSVEQVGAILGGVSERKIRAMVSTGELPKPKKVGRLSRWRRADIEKWVADIA